MLSKLWATYEMNFWERKIHGVDLSDATVKRFGRVTNQSSNKCFSQNTFNLGDCEGYQMLLGGSLQ